MANKGKGKDMSRLKILVAGLICGLIISLAFSVSVAWELMKSQELYRAVDTMEEKGITLPPLFPEIFPIWFLIGWIIYISLFALIIVLLLRMIRNENEKMKVEQKTS